MSCLLTLTPWPPRRVSVADFAAAPIAFLFPDACFVPESDKIDLDYNFITLILLEFRSTGIERTL